MPRFRNTDYKPHSWLTVEKPLSNEGFLLFITSELGNSEDFRANISGALSILAHEETWDYDTEISSAYAQLEVFYMDFCEKVAECILNSESVQSALTEFTEQLPTSQGGTGLGRVLPTETLETEILSTCDKDNLYAACTQLVDFIHASILDFLEIVEAGTGRLERMNVVVSAIPIVGILPVDEALLFLDQLIENFTNNYAAQYTATLRDEYACELFCIAQENCVLTFDDMATYFEGKASATFNRVSLVEAIDWFVFGTWSGDLIVHGMHALFSWAVLWGSDFFGIDLNRIVRIVQAASNDSDSDWTAKCDDCNDAFLPITVTFDAGGYEDYSILQGTVQAFGNGGNALRDIRTCANCNNKAEINVLFDTAQYVDAISVDVYTLFDTITWSIIAYDGSDNVLWSDSGNPVTNEIAWTTLSYTALDISGVRRIKISNGNGSGGFSTFLDNRIDNIYVA